MAYEIEDYEFKVLCDNVLSRIPAKYVEEFPCFSIYEGYSKWGAHVIDDSATFNVGMLKKVAMGDNQVLIGIIAHEFAHVFLGHADGEDERTGLEKEREADQLARHWGFVEEIEEFRRRLQPSEDGQG